MNPKKFQKLANRLNQERTKKYGPEEACSNNQVFLVQYPYKEPVKKYPSYKTWLKRKIKQGMKLTIDKDYAWLDTGEYKMMVSKRVAERLSTRGGLHPKHACDKMRIDGWVRD